jgi:glycosyltransferase involved in cell wall biosynthesis
LALGEDIGPKVKVPRQGNRLAMGVNVVGPIQYESGLGEAARGSIKILESLGLPCAKVPAPMVLNTARGTYYSESELSRKLAYKVNLFHLNGPEMGVVHRHWPRVFSNGQYNIGFWVFELERIPQSWVAFLRGLNEIWTPSTFSRDAIAPFVSVPVHVIPTAIDIHYPDGACRREFGLPEAAVCVMAAFDLNSTRARKNPDATVEAFKRAWLARKDLHLVLKISNADKNWQAVRDIRERLKGVEGVTFITEVLPRDKLTRLQAVCDIYLSLHRSEGFGLHLTECMALGLPVVATDWSANRDYLNESNGMPVPYRLEEIAATIGPYEKGNRWAEADVAAAAEKLILLASDGARRKALGAAAKEQIKSLYSVQAVAQVVAMRYRAVEDSLSTRS